MMMEGHSGELLVLDSDWKSVPSGRSRSIKTMRTETDGPGCAGVLVLCEQKCLWKAPEISFGGVWIADRIQRLFRAYGPAMAIAWRLYVLSR